MSVIARRIVATPERTTSETWAFITSLVCQDDETATGEFQSVTGLASACISEEALQYNPLVIAGKGARLRIYCLFGDEAISGERASEDALSWKPTESDWKAYLPCASEDFEWMKTALPAKSSHFVAYDLSEGLPEIVRELSDEQQKSSQSANINVGRFNEL